MRICRIERSKHKKDRILLHLEEGAILRITENELLRSGLQVGEEIDEETAKALESAGRRSENRAYAACLAGKSLLSRRQLCDKLEKRGVDAREARETAEWLVELGALDDSACAGTIARHYGAMGYGHRRVEQELHRRGIPKELWDDALAQLPPPEESIKSFLCKKVRGEAATPENCRKWAAALERRGFSWHEIRPVLSRMGRETEETI